MHLKNILSVFAAVWMAATAHTALGNQFGIDTSQFGPEGVWNSYCEVDRMTDAASCRLYIYRLYENGRDVEYISISVLPTGLAGGDFSLFLSTSEGLVESCALRVDRLDKVDSRMASINMCVFADGTGSQIINELKNGSSLLVRANFLNSGRRDLDFTLNGFTRNFEEMQRAMRVAQR